MQFLSLLGKKLKDDTVIEVLEDLDIDVVYDFDRLHENQPDKYWAISKGNGFEFGFNETQILEVIFLHVTPRDDFAAIAANDCDVPFFTSAEDVQRFGEAQGLQITKGTADFLGVHRDWVRLGFVSHSIHYEFHEGSLALITITKTDG